MRRTTSSRSVLVMLVIVAGCSQADLTVDQDSEQAFDAADVSDEAEPVETERTPSFSRGDVRCGEDDAAFWGEFAVPWAAELDLYDGLGDAARKVDLVVVGRVVGAARMGSAGPDEVQVPFSVYPLAIDAAWASDEGMSELIEGGHIQLLMPGEGPETPPEGHVLLFVVDVALDGRDDTVLHRPEGVDGPMYVPADQQAIFIQECDGDVIAPVEDAVVKAHRAPDLSEVITDHEHRHLAAEGMRAASLWDVAEAVDRSVGGTRIW
jgi:hypothetical protein